MHSKSILLVDDSPSMGQFLALFLSKKYDVTVCESPVEALEKVRDGLRPDAVVTDIYMPEMDGHLLLSCLRRIVPETPVMMLSGAKDSTNRLKALHAGADDFMTKPFHPAELDVRLGKMLSADGSQLSLAKRQPKEPTSIWEFFPQQSRLEVEN